MLRFMGEKPARTVRESSAAWQAGLPRASLFGSPAAPAQAETNASQIWGHINAGYLIAYEYTRWWKESLALRNAAVIGDWSWFNKTLVRGRDAARLMNYATVKDLSKQAGPNRLLAHDERRRQGRDRRPDAQARRGRIPLHPVGGLKWLEFLREKTSMKVTLEDVTPDYTCYALQGPRSTEVSKPSPEKVADLRFSRFRKTSFDGTEVLVARQGVTGEIGYEFLMRTDTGRAHELWRRLREVGRDFGLRELGFKAQMIGHTETGIATVIRDFLPARGSPEQLRRMMRHWMSVEELERMDYPIEEHLCSPAELGWGYTISLDKAIFLAAMRSCGNKTKAAEAAAHRPRMVERGHGEAPCRAIRRCTLRPAARPADRAVPRVLPEGPRGRLGLGLCLQPDAAPHDLPRRLDREIPAGTKVQVRGAGSPTSRA